MLSGRSVVSQLSCNCNKQRLDYFDDSFKVFYPIRHKMRPKSLVRSIGDQDIPEFWEGLSKSKIFGSKIVQQERDRFFEDFTRLAKMFHKFADFDIEGKKMYIKQCEEAMEMVEIFMKRIELSDDTAARQFFNSIEAKLQNGIDGYSIGGMYSMVRDDIERMKSIVKEEEKLVGDPIAHQQYLVKQRAAWQARNSGFLDITKLQQVDPMLMFRAQQDPELFKAISEIAADPSQTSKWMDNPNIGPLLAALWKLSNEL